MTYRDIGIITEGHGQQEGIRPYHVSLSEGTIGYMDVYMKIEI